ncbi:MAG: glucose-6-phosphate isomerase [Acidobacteria bacterium]|nr:MAG: glucose-6-phosphate isomerase [Acidobacteriota bacterium]
MDSAHELLTRWPALDVAARRAHLQNSLHLSSGPLAGALKRSTDAAERVAAGLWRGDPSVWSGDPAVQKAIADRLGWMSSPALMAGSIDRLETFAAKVKHDGFTDVVLLGMGGSSLAPEVLRAVLGVAPGWPRLRMLDSTDPAAVQAAATPPERTLYLLASKSGTTIEPNSLAAHFRQRLLDAGVARWADHFVAITDEGTELDHRARAERFRDDFINPSDIGGRYSALSFFGLVPAALMGQDIAAIVGWAVAMLAASEPGAGNMMANPAVALGLALGAGARDGRDKLTLIVPASLEAFGLWVEQLIAESTGKNGTGIVPIAGERLADQAAYGSDRLFVRVRVPGEPDEEKRDAAVRALEAAQAPVVAIDVPEPTALGAEFLRWEIATAVAGGLLRIDPFDQPNVKQAKDATQTLLNQYNTTGRLPAGTPDRTLAGNIAVTLTASARKTLQGTNADAILTLLHPGDYFALLAYLGPDPELAQELLTLRHAVRDRLRVATMFGYGPRYLHSTGQLHKGGPNTGVFLLISATPLEDLPIPGESFSFGTLELAQAVGDFASLDAAARRAAHAHLPVPDRKALRQLSEMLLARLPATNAPAT